MDTDYVESKMKDRLYRLRYSLIGWAAGVILALTFNIVLNVRGIDWGLVPSALTSAGFGEVGFIAGMVYRGRG